MQESTLAEPSTAAAQAIDNTRKYSFEIAEGESWTVTIEPETRRENRGLRNDQYLFSNLSLLILAYYMTTLICRWNKCGPITCTYSNNKKKPRITQTKYYKEKNSMYSKYYAMV